MPDTEAFVLPPRDPATATARKGRSLCERVLLALHRGGVDRLVVSSKCDIADATRRRFARLRIPLLTREAAACPVDGTRLVVVSSDVVFEPGAVRALVDKLVSRNVPAVAAMEASPGTFAALGPDAAGRLARTGSDADILDRLDTIRVTSLGNAFCRPILKPGDAAEIERSYTRHIRRLDGLMAKVARLLTLPITRVFHRLGTSHTS